MLEYNTLMDSKYKLSKSIMYSCRYHVVWCTKYRRKVLEGEVGIRFVELVEFVCKERGILLIGIEYVSDHVHLRLEVDPRYGIHRAVKAIKGKTSGALREEFPSLRTRVPTLWTNSYFVSTASEVPLEDIACYVRIQKTSQRD